MEAALLSLPLILIVAAAIVYSLQGLHRVVFAFSQEKPVSKEEYFTARHVLIRLSRIVLLGSLLCFLPGYLERAWGNPAWVLSSEGVLTGLFTISSALLFGFVQININHLILAKPRSMLNIQQLDEKRGEKEMSLLSRNVLTSVSMMAYGMLFALIIGHNILMVFQRALDGAGKGASLEALEMLSLDAAGRIMLLSFSFLLTMGIILQYTASKVMQMQITRLRDKVYEMAEGRIRVNDFVLVEQFDEVGQLASGINKFISSQKKFLGKLAEIGDLVGSSSGRLRSVIEDASGASQQMAASIEQVSRNANEQLQTVRDTGDSLRQVLNSLDSITQNVEVQSGFVEETSSAMHQMAESIRQVGETTGKADELSGQLEAVAQKGTQAVQDSVQAIKRIEQVSRDVNGMVALISDFADRTNLLSLNAAIEAAHAGEAGKGFAVVAEEVRSLAHNSSENAYNITEQLKEMMDVVTNGVQLSEHAGQALTEISRDVRGSADIMREISSSMEEQKEGTQKILDSMSSLVKATEQIRTVAEEQKARNNRMHEEIQQLISSFQEIENATSEQNTNIGKIVETVYSLQRISEENGEVVQRLNGLLESFVEEEAELSAQEIAYRKSRQA